MPVVKKRNQQTESRLLLEGDDPVELPPAEIADGAVLVQFEKFKPFIPELLEALRAGTSPNPCPSCSTARLSPCMGDAHLLGQALAHGQIRVDAHRTRSSHQLPAFDARRPNRH